MEVRFMKKKAFMCILIGMVAVSAVAIADGETAKVIINGEQQNFETPPIIINDRTMVPMRAVFEALGAQIEWDDSTSTVKATSGDTIITLKIDDSDATVNNKIVHLDVPAQLLNDRTFVPLRFVSEALGAEVKWDEAEQAAIIDLAEKTPETITVELEGGKVLCGKVVENDKASSGKAILVEPDCLEKTVVETTVKFDTAGIYQIWAYINAPDNKSDGIYITCDELKERTWPDYSNLGEFDSCVHPLTIEITEPCEKVIGIVSGETGMMLDKLEIIGINL